MREIIRENIHTAYSLHDMNVIDFEVQGNDIIMRTQSGMIKVSEPCLQVDGSLQKEKLSNVSLRFTIPEI